MQTKSLRSDENKGGFYAMQTDFWKSERLMRAILVNFATTIYQHKNVTS
jgi:hypothetical protein